MIEELDPEKEGHLDAAYELGYAVGFRYGYQEGLRDGAAAYMEIEEQVRKQCE